MKFIDLLKECGFEKPFDTCINIHTKNFDYNLAFIEAETKDKLCILVTDESGREKLRILNKEYIESVEIVYADDVSIGNEEKSKDKMFG